LGHRQERLCYLKASGFRRRWLGFQ